MYGLLFGACMERPLAVPFSYTNRGRLMLSPCSHTLSRNRKITPSLYRIFCRRKQRRIVLYSLHRQNGIKHFYTISKQKQLVVSAPCFARAAKRFQGEFHQRWKRGHPGVLAFGGWKDVPYLIPCKPKACAAQPDRNTAFAVFLSGIRIMNEIRIMKTGKGWERKFHSINSPEQNM